MPIFPALHSDIPCQIICSSQMELAILYVYAFSVVNHNSQTIWEWGVKQCVQSLSVIIQKGGQEVTCFYFLFNALTSKQSF